MDWVDWIRAEQRGARGFYAPFVFLGCCHLMLLRLLLLWLLGGELLVKVAEIDWDLDRTRRSRRVVINRTCPVIGIAHLVR